MVLHSRWFTNSSNRNSGEMPKKLNHNLSNSQTQVRPIGARALKSAMDTLRPHLLGARLLDLFSGQGRFGIEASYEKIESVTFVEKHRTTALALKQSLQQKSFPKDVKTCVECQEAINFLTHCASYFDIVFADPPFPLWDEVFHSRLFSSVVRVLRPGSIFLVKSPSRMVLFPLSEDWKLIKQSEFGESLLLYYQYEGPKQNKSQEQAKN
ncbi:MAG: hypothetical protein FJ112_03390 [Deltaproteobacteria bacterium]|nr:hypothetical protein [Deltaproteobacteria bacterium]